MCAFVCQNVGRFAPTRRRDGLNLCLVQANFNIILLVIFRGTTGLPATLQQISKGTGHRSSRFAFAWLVTILDTQPHFLLLGTAPSSPSRITNEWEMLHRKEGSKSNVGAVPLSFLFRPKLVSPLNSLWSLFWNLLRCISSYIGNPVIVGFVNHFHKGSTNGLLLFCSLVQFLGFLERWKKSEANDEKLFRKAEKHPSAANIYFSIST